MFKKYNQKMMSMFLRPKVPPLTVPFLPGKAGVLSLPCMVISMVQPRSLSYYSKQLLARVTTRPEKVPGLKSPSLSPLALIIKRENSSLQRPDGYKRWDKGGGNSWQFSSPYLLFYPVLGACLAAFFLYIVTHLERVPITGRLRYMHTSKKFEDLIQKKSYHDMLANYQDALLPSSHPYCKLVQRVASRLIHAGDMDKEGIDWQVFVVQDPTMNAFVLPGGKIFVCTGMFRVLETEDALAVVIGHEIAHQLARHTSEMLSRFQLFILFQILYSVLVTPISSQSPIFELALKRPHSRKMELEADYIGLHLVARACYNPEIASQVWRNLQQVDRNSPPEFFSTHPSHESRIECIKEWLPAIRKIRDAADCGDTATQFTLFRRFT